MHTEQSTVLIIEDDVLFYPDFLTYLLTKSPIKISGLIIARPAMKNNRYLQALKTLRYYTLLEIVKLTAKLLKTHLRGKTLAFIAKRHGISFIVAAGNANTPDIIAWLKSKKPDIIFSASPLILREKILSIPRISINMHFSLLPAYKGIMPLFHAMANGELQSGISLHEMTNKIDEGRVIYQRAIPLNYNVSLMDNYIKFFYEAVSCVMECMAAVSSEQKISSMALATRSSYFKYPDAEDWKKFRARGLRFI